MAASAAHAASTRTLELPSGRALVAIELALVIGLLEFALWADGPFLEVPRVLAVAVAVAIAWRAHRRRQATQARRKAYGRQGSDWMLCLGWSLAAALSLLLVASFARTEGERFRFFWMEKGAPGFSEWLLVKGAIVVLQQLALHMFLFPSFLDLFRHRWTARISAAAVFGLIHLPSPGLVVLTMAAACMWSWLWERTGRLTPLVVSHLMLAILAHAAVPERLNCNMRVGSRALEVARRYGEVQTSTLAESFRTIRSDHYYQVCGGRDREFIQCLYADVLLRGEPPKREDVDIWMAKLRNHSRADLAADFLTCPEFVDLRKRDELKHVQANLNERMSRLAASQLDSIRR